jgi:preprotein translocase subunit SecG
MNAFHTILIIVQVLSAITIIGLVLLQHGKGADMGAAFGSGASGSLFGASGSSNFMSKSTGVAAAIFFSATLALAFLGNIRTTASGGVMENLPVASAPAATVSAPSASVPAAVPTSTPVTTRPAASGAASAADKPNQIPK